MTSLRKSSCWVALAAAMVLMTSGACAEKPGKKEDDKETKDKKAKDKKSSAKKADDKKADDKKTDDKDEEPEE